MKIQLGDEVQHIHSGFKGIATCRATYISGCDRITISPKVGKDGKLGDAVSFDEPEVKIIKARKVENKTSSKGGFQPTARHHLKG